ncbi:MAG TPA: hypothetical protein VFX70_18085 [Mycobacteriales bacterium]|nr:hypothetical protein [Mycobacteriales bacterium]
MTPHPVLADHRFAAVSVHTSGQRPPEIVELSVVTIDRGAVSSAPLTWVAGPTRPVTGHAIRGYGIRVGELSGRAPFAAVAGEVAAVLDTRRLVAHGARVVADALDAELPDLRPPAVLDTLPLVRRVWPYAAPGSLPELAVRARLRLPDAAAGTAWRAQATARLFLYLTDRLAGTLPDLTAERLCRIAARYRHRAGRDAR